MNSTVHNSGQWGGEKGSKKNNISLEPCSYQMLNLLASIPN